MLNIQNENKIMNYKNGLINEYNRNLEKEKKKNCFFNSR